MKNLFLTTVNILFSIIANAQLAANPSETSSNKNNLESKISKKIKLDDVVLSKQPLILKNKKYKFFESKITIDNDFVYNYIVFYNNSKLNSIVKLNPIGNSKSVEFVKLVNLYNLKNLNTFGKKSIALDEY
jgi:hypothetical protein